jgi:hypothetical protein
MMLHQPLNDFIIIIITVITIVIIIVIADAGSSAYARFLEAKPAQILHTTCKQRAMLHQHTEYSSLLLPAMTKGWMLCHSCGTAMHHAMTYATVILC